MRPRQTRPRTRTINERQEYSPGRSISNLHGPLMALVSTTRMSSLFREDSFTSSVSFTTSSSSAPLLSSREKDDDAPRYSLIGWLSRWVLYMALSFHCPIFHSSSFIKAFVISEAFGLCAILCLGSLRRGTRLQSRLNCIGLAFWRVFAAFCSWS